MFANKEIERAHFIPLRPNGISLTEEHHEQRKDAQALLVENRIQELMAGDDPLPALMASKLAHRGLGFDKFFDEAIEELRHVFGYKDSDIRSASADAFRKEAERRQRIKDAAKGAARRAGLPVEEDEESLATGLVADKAQPVAVRRAPVAAAAEPVDFIGT